MTLRSPLVLIVCLAIAPGAARAQVPAALAPPAAPATVAATATAATVAATAAAAAGQGADDDESEAPPAEEAVAPEPDAVAVDEGIAATLADGRSIALRVTLDGSQDYAALAKRLCGAAAHAGALAAANADAPVAPGRTIVVPWELVRPEYRFLALRALFPDDAYRNGAFEHRPSAARLPNAGEGLWQVALWFGGDGEKWPEIAKANGLTGPNLPGAGRVVRIPDRLVLPTFRPVVRGPGGLRYVETAEGPFAEYNLARGEALYSSVVVRFTELTRPGDVNAAAETVRRASGIADVRRMEVGQKVRIPLDLLAARFLPENHPKRVVARLREAEIADVAPPAPARALEGVYVLLDPGHGGDDVGAKHGKVWESDYVYDIACRVQRLLAGGTSATAKMLVRDTQHGCRVFDTKSLKRNGKEVVDTQPPQPIRRGATDLTVNLRWYLANDVYRQLRAQGVPEDKVVFLSLHADSLHKSMRGGMVYIPGERYRRATQGETGKSYARFREYRNGPKVVLTRQDRLRDEAASRRLAESIIAGYRAEKLPVHDDEPVRDKIVRGRGKQRIWVPAVLRANLVPTKVLVETVNLGNPDDAALLQDPAGRERIARAIVAGLERHYASRDERIAER